MCYSTGLIENSNNPETRKFDKIYFDSIILYWEPFNITE